MMGVFQKSQTRSGIAKFIAVLLAMVLAVTGCIYIGTHVDDPASADGGAGGGWSGSDGTTNGTCTPHYIVYDAMDANGNPVQGWDGTSADSFWGYMMSYTPQIARDQSVYYSAANDALASARNRGTASGMVNPRARIVAVGWLTLDGHQGMGANYQPGLDINKPSARYILPSPYDKPGLWNGLQPSETWDVEADGAYGAWANEMWKDYIYRVSVVENAVYDNYFGKDLSVIVIAACESEPEAKGQVEISKKYKDGANWSGANSQYGLNGATYGVYRNAACTEFETSFTTKYDPAHGNGYGISEKIKKGDYYLKEISPSPGYSLSTEIYPITIESGEVTTTRKPVYEDVPVAFAFGIEKMDYNRYVDANGNAPQGAASLAGAKYKITYADGMYTTPADIRAHKWSKWSPVTVQTNLVGNRAIAALSPDQMLTDGNGGKTLPLGSYLIEEIEPPIGYHLTKDALENQTGYVVQVRRDSVTGPAVVHAINASASPDGTITRNHSSDVLDKNFDNTLISVDMVKRADISINKFIEITTDPDQYPDKKKPAPGIKFQIINNNDNSVKNVETGAYIAKGQVIYELTTNEDGWASTSQKTNYANQTGQSSGALPIGHYIIREVPGTQPDGYDVIDDCIIEIGWNKKSDCTLKCCATAGEWNKHVADNNANQNSGGDRNAVFNDSTGTVVKLLKKDAVTGKTVRGETKFQVLKKEADGSKTVMDFDVPYPQSGTVNTLVTGVDGTVTLPDKFMPGTYYVREVKAANGYLWNNAEIEFTCTTETAHDHGKYSAPYEIVFPDKPAMTRLDLTKTDSRNGKKILDATARYFVWAAEDITTPDGTVRATRGELVDTIHITNGEGVSKDLFPGKYNYQEDKDCVPDGYLWDETMHQVELTYANDHIPVNVIERSVSDDPVYGKIGIEKRDSLSGKLIPDDTATFAVRAAEDIVGHEGSTFHKKGEQLDEITTDANGRAVSERAYELGTYEFVELNAPGGYALNKEPVRVELKYADATTPQVQALGIRTNDPQRFVLSVEKLDRETGVIVPLSNTEMELYAAENIYRPEGTLVHETNKLVDTITTDETGLARTDADDIVCGKYYLKETKAPRGYVLDSERTYNIALSWESDGRAVVQRTAAISDVPAKGRITFTKVDAESGLPVKVAGCNVKIYANEDITTGDGTIRVKKDAEVANLVTDDSGSVTSDLLYLGSYRIEEQEAPYGYLYNPDPVNVVLEYENDHVAVVSAANKIADENAKGVIEITKRDKESGKIIPLAGATFEITAKTDIVTGDGVVHAPAGTVVDTASTDGSGTCASKELYLGNYTVHEITAPYGYTLDDTYHDAQIVYKDQHTPVTTTSQSVENLAQKGVITVNKLDSESGMHILSPDATFEVKAKDDIVTADGTLHASAGEVVDTIITNEEGVAKTKALYLGTYTISETQAPDGYLLSEQSKEVTLAYGEQTEPLVYENTNIADVPVKGQITVNKTDFETDEPLEGVKYDIRATKDIIGKDAVEHHKQGDVIETIVTDENGTATSSELYLGEYAVVETTQLDGYELDETEYSALLEYKDQMTPIVHVEHGLRNIPSHIFVKKVSVNDETTILPDTHFIGWNKADEATEQFPFAVFFSGDYEVTKATIDYYGQFENVIVNDDREVAKHIELSAIAGSKQDKEDNDNNNESNVNENTVPDNADNAANDELADKATQDEDEKTDLVSKSEPYTVFAAKDKADQGEYVLHLTYKHDGKETSEDVSFVVNEHDKNAIFAIGNIVDADAKDATCFNRDLATDTRNTDGTDRDESANAVDKADKDTGADKGADVKESDSGIAVQEYANDMDFSDANNNEENTNSGATGDATNDGNNDSGKEEEPDDGDDNEENADGSPETPVTASVAKRVPVLLHSGVFAHSVTGNDGLAEFKYVPQGEIGFAEFLAPEGYTTDRTPQYVTFTFKGMIDNATELEEIMVQPDSDSEEAIGSGNVIGLKFADESLKLSVSKRDITTSEELPGNTLSVYKAKTDGTVGVDEGVSESDYGELIETWVSSTEPHMIQLLPQGSYILKEEQAVEGFTVAQDIKFQVNNTGIVQQVAMNNEHEAAVADELVETLGETGIAAPIMITIIFVSSVVFALAYRKRKQIADMIRAMWHK